MEEINNTDITNRVIDNNSQQSQIPPRIQPTFSKQNNTFKLLFFITFITLIVVTTTNFLLLNKKQIINEEQIDTSISNTEIKKRVDDTLEPTIQIKEETSDPKQILIELQKTLNTNSSLEDYKSNYPTCDLKINDKERVPLVGQQFFLCGSDNRDCSAWGNFNDVTEITKESLQPLKLLVDNFFISNNFKKDINNRLVSDTGEYIYYIKGNLRCYLGLIYNLTNFPYYDLSNHIAFFFCGTIDQDNFNLKKDLYSIINPTSSTDVFFVISTTVGNYARGGKGTYSSGVCGYDSWFAVKLNEKWELIWDFEEGRKKNQNWIPCDIVDKYNIPKEITSGCYDTTKFEMKTL